MDSAAFHLIIDPLDLGLGVRAISLDLKEAGSADPAVGGLASAVWAVAMPALAAETVWSLDFIGHLDRVREYCEAHGIGWRAAAKRCTVLPALPPEELLKLLMRFETERFGIRAGANLDEAVDTALENELSSRGLDAYQNAFANYLFCGICDFENGSLTLLSDKMSSSEALRRLRPALTPLGVRVERPD
ncbi:MAG TPA: hypothetical protein VKR82_14090 [Candidatus Acidoferrales bacterium]|nr:hypothetical protein [Candidatus Acidoferrales bacterium]